MRAILSEEKLNPLAKQAMETFHPGIVNEVQTAIQSNEWVIVGMAQNPVVKKAKALLNAKNISFKYLEYGSYFSQWKQRLAIKLWSGWPTYPQVFYKGKLIGGAQELGVFLDSTK